MKNSSFLILLLGGLITGVGILFSPASAADFRPDLLVGETRDSLKGNDQYLGGNQKIKIELNGSAKFFVRVENNGDLTDQIRLRGRKGNRHFDVNYFDESNGDANITAELIRGQFMTSDLANGEGLFIRGEVDFKPKEHRGKGKGQGRGQGGKRQHFKVSGASANDPAARDIVRAFVATAKGKKPKKDKPGKKS